MPVSRISAIFVLFCGGSHSGLVRPPAKRLPREIGVMGSNPFPPPFPTPPDTAHTGQAHTRNEQLLHLDRRLPDEQGGLGAARKRPAADGVVPHVRGLRRTPTSIVLNSCVVRQSAEDRVVGMLGSAQAGQGANDPDKVLALMGCMVGPKSTDALERRFPLGRRLHAAPAVRAR